MWRAPVGDVFLKVTVPPTATVAVDGMKRGGGEVLVVMVTAFGGGGGGGGCVPGPLGSSDPQAARKRVSATHATVFI